MSFPQYNNSRGLLEPPLWFNRLLSFGEKLLHVPGLRAFGLLARQIKAVAEPIERLSFRILPNRPAAHSGEVITVLSSNLCHDWPRFRRQEERLERLAHLVEREGVDILLLQEVSRTHHLKVDHWLSQRLGMTSVYSRANGLAAAIGFEEGVALLSHFPIAAPRSQQLGTGRNPFIRRLALSADVMTPRGRLALFSVHLGLLPRHNARQLAHLFSWVDALAHDRPALIGGDFNVHENSFQIRQAQQNWLDTFRHLHPQAKGVTHELRAWGKIPFGRRRLDYVFFKPHQPCWHIAEAHHLDTPGGSHSDHRAVLLRLKSRTKGLGWPA
jgi:endonuclease/exonuclease/phosphatase family metal-dependent hydrolase